MGEFATPCICCGKEIRNIFDDAENQPYGGTTFTSHGHYGSTAYDPMDGRYLEINLCDKCLNGAQARHHVLEGRSHKLVLAHGFEGFDGPIVVGRTKTNRRLVPWNGDGGGDEDDVLYVEPEEVGDTELLPEIEWLPTFNKEVK